MTKKRQVQIYWVVVAGMLIFLLGSTLIKTNILQGVGLLIIVVAFFLSVAQSQTSSARS